MGSFRESILEGRWEAVESVLEHVGVRGEDDLRVSVITFIFYDKGTAWWIDKSIAFLTL